MHESSLLGSTPARAPETLAPPSLFHISGDLSPSPSRRQSLAATVALIAAAVSVGRTSRAGQVALNAKAPAASQSPILPPPDAALLALCAEFNQAGAAVRAFDASDDCDLGRCDVVLNRWYAALGAVMAVRPTTMGGLRAKGACALAALHATIVFDHVEREEQFAMNVLADLVGAPYWEPAEGDV